MKNIFLKETDQKSKLYRNLLTDKLFILEDKVTDVSECNREYQFIYITNDEKIEDGNWVFQECLNMPHRLIKTDAENVKVLNNLNKCKKVVLTNDTFLIEDGVQKVNSSFLSFYAENTPNYVEVDDYIERVGWESDENGRDMILNKRFYSLNFPPKEIKTEENVIDQWLEKYGNPEIMKQVEKEAELYQTINKIIDGGKNLPKGFEVSRGQAIDYAFDVALEVAEKLYTEEDLHNAFYNGWIYRGENYTFPKAKKEWSDENKK